MKNNNRNIIIDKLKEAIKFSPEHIMNIRADSCASIQEHH